MIEVSGKRRADTQSRPAVPLAVEVILELSQSHRHLVCRCDEVDDVGVALEVLPKEGTQHPGHKLITVEIAVVGCIRLANVSDVAGCGEGGGGG